MPRLQPSRRPCARLSRPAVLAVLTVLGSSALWGLVGCATPATQAAAQPAAAAAMPPSAPASAPRLLGAPGALVVRPGAAASAPTAAPVAVAPPAPPTPGLPPPFALVIKDAKKFDGLFTLYQKDEKVWIELRPEDFNQPLYFSPKIAQGIGESRILGGTMVGSYGSFGRSQVIEFQRVHTQVRMVAKNRQFRADAGTPQARSVAAGFSDSLLASTLVVSQPHPERKTVLVDAAPLFLGDLLGVATSLQRAYRQGYSMDGRHTGFTTVRSLPDQVVFNVQAHFATPNLASPMPGAPPGAPIPTLPGTLPDARSMFIGLYYSLAKLPEQAMPARRADPRVGYFVTAVDDFSNDLGLTPRLRHVNRWRLDKKDPAAEVSEPVKPITFWVDRTVPLKYRDAVTRGILEWNKAFDKIGFKGAVVARQQADDASFDTLDVGIASVRFISSAEPSFDGFGPSITDPRSGEILDADIVIDGNAARTMRGLRTQVINRSEPGTDSAYDANGQIGTSADLARLMQFGNPRALAAADANGHRHADGSACEFGSFAAEQYGYALDVLESRGDIAPDSPLADEFALQRIFAVTVHEVGHALGLRHNFRSSRAYTLAQLADPEFTAANGTAASVMDYVPINLPPPGVPFERYGAPHRSALGTYDYWAIEYAYKPVAAADEADELRRIAARSNEPALAFGTDEDAGLGIDPESLTFDLGDDPVAYAKSRFAIARDLLQRQETRQLSEGANYTPLRRAVRYAVRDVAAAAGVLARQIGGLRTLRDYPGSGRDPLQPVPGRQQRAALDALAQNVLATDSLRLSPALQRRLAPDFEQRGEDRDGAPTDYSMIESVIAVQRALLGQLMSDTLAARILDNEGKFEPATAGKPADAFHLSELYSRLTREVWSELDKPTAGISAARRELQREHLNRLASQMLRPAAQSRADARALMRAQARELLPRLQAAAKRGGWDAQARAHLSDAADTLSQALAAPMVRAGV